MHLQTGIDGEAAAVQLKELQVAADFPFILVILVNTAAARNQFVLS